jgi:hypothetical protein
MRALVTINGTAARETALCDDCFRDPDTRNDTERGADYDVDKRSGWQDCTGNDELNCNQCGESGP